MEEPSLDIRRYVVERVGDPGAAGDPGADR
jgi:hypothetical protein